ncbi:MAG: GIY-YIG nuclease family protein [Cyanobacteria bacterium P01_E01_bin.34]
MSTSVVPATLADLPYLPFISTDGLLPHELSGTVGAYAIFDSDRQLQYVGYSRDVLSSLRLHLVRKPTLCHWVKVQAINRPSRTVLEGICEAWVGASGSIPLGNGPASGWDSPVDVKCQMTDAEHMELASPELDERARTKALKQVARRVESEILAVLAERNVQEPLRFHPKLKEKGLLDLKG